MRPIVDRLTPPLIKRRVPYVYPDVTHVRKYRRLSASFCVFAESLRRRLPTTHDPVKYTNGPLYNGPPRVMAREVQVPTGTYSGHDGSS